MRRRRSVLGFAAASVGVACAAHSVVEAPPPRSQQGHAGWNGDATVRGARLVPGTIDRTTAVPVAPGGARGLVQGVRYTIDARGGVRTAGERIDEPSVALPIPARMGGGFLFVIGDLVYRAEDWLSRARPVLRPARGVRGAFVGLDRVYFVGANGAHFALDARTGAEVDLGPWPADPIVADYVALDGWHAVALTDTRGAVHTVDAGHSWSALDLPSRGESLTAVVRDGPDDRWAIAGPDALPEAVLVADAPLRQALQNPDAACVVVSPAGNVERLARCSEVALPQPHAWSTAATLDSAALRAAIEDGWPLDDGTAIVATGGSLARVSLSDGTVVAVVEGAFDRSLTHCHAFAVASASRGSAVGFVCGAPRGRTALFAYEEGRLAPVREFARPRSVQGTARGGWLVRGPCDPASDAAGDERRYCVGTPAGDARGYAWRDAALPPPAGGPVALLEDGSLARLSGAGSPLDAQLVVSAADGASSTTGLHAGEVTPGMRKILDRAAWVGDVEERRPSVLGGWLTVDGTVVGAEIDRDGTVRVGAYLRDLGSPFVAGRYGLGWTRSKLGFETTDGGRSWVPFGAPGRLDVSRTRACGPAGCSVDGWLRVGWGERPSEGRAVALAAPALAFHGGPPPPLRLSCRLATPLDARAHPALPPPRQPTRAGVVPRRGAAASGVLVAAAAAPPVPPPMEEPWLSPPGVTTGLVQVDLPLAADGFGRRVPLGRVSAWGPSAGSWAGVGRWVTRWRSPFEGRASVVASATSPAAFTDADAARAEFGIGRGNPSSWSILVSDDASHALLVTRAAGRPTQLTSLDERSPPAPLARADGGAWGLIDTAVRLGGEWIIAAPDDTSRRRIRLFRVDAAGGRPFATVNRRIANGGGGPVRLARAEAGGRVGVVIEGEPASDRGVARRWVIPVDLDSGEAMDPEPLGAADLSDRAAVGLCPAGGGEGWVYDALWPGATVTLDLGNADTRAQLRRIYVRLHVSADRACIERLSGESTAEALQQARGRSPSSSTAADGRPSMTTVVSADGPVELACSLASR